MLAGSYQAWSFTFTLPMPASSPPYPITGATWEYVARTSQTDTSEPPLIEIGTSYTPQGLITITDSATVSSALLTIYPAATAALAPGAYAHSLWMNPSTSTAFPWFSGPLLIAGNPQP
jgi:hypothetical protein